MAAAPPPPETSSRGSSSAPPGRSSMPSSDSTSSPKEISASVGSSRLLRCVSICPCSSLFHSFGDLVGGGVMGMVRFALWRLGIWSVRDWVFFDLPLYFWPVTQYWRFSWSRRVVDCSFVVVDYSLRGRIKRRAGVIAVWIFTLFPR